MADQPEGPIKEKPPTPYLQRYKSKGIGRYKVSVWESCFGVCFPVWQDSYSRQVGSWQVTSISGAVFELELWAKSGCQCELGILEPGGSSWDFPKHQLLCLTEYRSVHTQLINGFQQIYLPTRRRYFYLISGRDKVSITCDWVSRCAQLQSKILAKPIFSSELF